jgi:hypothetical protein
MAERSYQGAGIGVTRMNRILDLLLFRSMTITEITLDLDICDRAARNYLDKLRNLGKITMARGAGDQRFKFYSLVPGVMPLPVPTLKRPRSRPLVAVKKKTGPKPRPRGDKAADGLQRVLRGQAVQVGLARDPLIAALFGGAQC